MNLLDLINNLKKVSTTNGGEWAGPCPFCGGNDRFRVWPEQGPTGRYWCRRCSKSGDGIQFLRDQDGLGYREACARLGVMPSLSFKPGTPTRQTATDWQPRKPKTPGIIWQEKASVFVEKSKLALWGPSGSDCRAFLANRGFKLETIKSSGLGWNPNETYQSRETWGLEPKLNDQKNPKRIWLPEGLVIPNFDQGRVIRLKIRRANPGKGDRYVFVAGTSSAPMTWGLVSSTSISAAGCIK